MSDNIESRMLLAQVFEQKNDYLTKQPRDRAKIDYLDRVHLLPDVPVSYGAKRMHGLKDDALRLSDKSYSASLLKSIPMTYNSSASSSASSISSAYRTPLGQKYGALQGMYL